MTNLVEAGLDLWVLIGVNLFEFVLASVITGVSFFAYRSTDRKPPLLNATIGFGLITVSTAVEPTYQFVIAGDYTLTTEQSIDLQIAEGVLLSLGLLVLFFSVYRYRSRSRRRTITVEGVDDDLFDGSN